MLKLFSRLVPLLAVLALAGCGGGHHTRTSSGTRTAAKSPIASTGGASGTSSPGQSGGQTCPSGQSFMGCATPHTLGLTPNATAPAGRLFTDVSSWQGHPDWAAARPHIAGAYVKASEYVEDPDFAWNVGQLKALGIRWGAYDFVRSCSASTFIAALRSVGGPTSLPPVIDMEVPAAAGCAPSLEAQIFAAFHRQAEIYTAPGTWPGGSNAGLGLWEATYGPSYSPVWHPVLAWQFTDGEWGSTVYIPGIGLGDVSVDYGLLEQLPPAPKPTPKPVSVFQLFPTLELATPYGTSNERLTAEELDGALQHPAKYATYLHQVLEPRAAWFAARISYLAYHVWPAPRPDWAANQGGSRYQYLIKASRGQRIA